MKPTEICGKKVWIVSLKNKEEIKELVDTLGDDKESSIIIRHDSDFICGITYSERKNKHIVYFDKITCHEWDDDYVYRMLSSVNEEFGILYAVLYPDKNHIFHEARQTSLGWDIKNLLNNEGNLPKILQHTMEDLGKPVNIHGDFGIMMSVTSTMEDYYYCILDTNQNIRFYSCVGGYEVLDRSECPEDLQQLLDNPHLKIIMSIKRMDCFINSDEVELINF